jgi:hypothetical protein
VRATQPSSKAQDLCGITGSFLHQMENGNTSKAIVRRKKIWFKNNRGANVAFIAI